MHYVKEDRLAYNVITLDMNIHPVSSKLQSFFLLHKHLKNITRPKIKSRRVPLLQSYVNVLQYIWKEVICRPLGHAPGTLCASERNRKF